jgi:dihydrofolate reductase
MPEIHRAVLVQRCEIRHPDGSPEAGGMVLWHMTMSLDGFIAGPDHEMDWVFDYNGPSAIADEVMKTTGAILAGRRWYDSATSRYRGAEGIYGGAWTGPVFVLTHRPPNASEDAAITFLTDGIDNAVATARAAAEGKNVVIFGANLARQCLDAGLLEEIVVHLAPVLLGDGVRMYGRSGAGRVGLERTAVAEAGDLTDLRFRVVKEASIAAL